MAQTQLTRLDRTEGLRFSGHETFACRYAWLPKAYRALKGNPAVFSDEDEAMVELGLGKNMVKSLRFWIEATGIAQPAKGRGFMLTDFSHAILGIDGFDPYLEDIRTLWLLHWQLASRLTGALFAWRYLLNHWPFPEFTRSEALSAFVTESAKLGHSHSIVTLSQHLDVFLHTYHSSRSASVGIEDSLDGPLVDLALIQPIGERRVDGGKWETVYAFRREPKSEITSALFEFCVADFWARFRKGEETLTLQEIAVGICSPGQIFKLPEDDIRARLEAYTIKQPERPFTYTPSAVQGLLSRRKGNQISSLSEVYNQRLSDA